MPHTTIHRDRDGTHHLNPHLVPKEQLVFEYDCGRFVDAERDTEVVIGSHPQAVKDPPASSLCPVCFAFIIHGVAPAKAAAIQAKAYPTSK